MALLNNTVNRLKTKPYVTADNTRVILSESYLLNESAALVCLFEASSHPSLGVYAGMCILCRFPVCAIVIYPCLSIVLQVLSFFPVPKFRIT
jgi:hypothetical protein